MFVAPRLGPLFLDQISLERDARDAQEGDVDRTGGPSGRRREWLGMIGRRGLDDVEGREKDGRGVARSVGLGGVYDLSERQVDVGDTM